MSGTAPVFALSDWVRAFANLMPRGKVWPRESDSTQAQAVAALLPTHTRQAIAAAGEIADSFPATTLTSLDDWEAAVGLPDPCSGEDATIPERQAHVVARLTYRGGQSVPYLIGFAASIGYTITITQFSRSRFGRPFGLTFGGPDWDYTWRVNSVGWVFTWIHFGTRAFGTPWRTWTTSRLVCELERIKPAHTILQFLSGAVAPTPNPTVSISAGVITAPEPTLPVSSMRISAGVISAMT